jgi:hypothetical protein
MARYIDPTYYMISCVKNALSCKLGSMPSNLLGKSLHLSRLPALLASGHR